MAQRAVRVKSVELAHRVEAGYPLGVLFLRGMICQAKHDAGEWYGRAVKRWRSLAGIRQPWAVKEGGIPRNVDPAEWDRLKSIVTAARKAIGIHHGAAIIDLMAADDMMPRMDVLASRPAVLATINAALGALIPLCPVGCRESECCCRKERT